MITILALASEQCYSQSSVRTPRGSMDDEVDDSPTDRTMNANRRRYNCVTALWERATRTSADTVSWAVRMLHSPADTAASEQSPRSGQQQTLPSTAETAEARS